MTPTQQLKVFSFILTILAFSLFDPLLFGVSFIVGWVLSGISVSALYHRKVSHRCFDFKNKFTEYFSYFLMVMSGQGTPLGWAIIHRTHHAKTDLPEDPQSPYSVGKFKTLISWYSVDNINPKLVIDVLRDKKLMFLHNHYNKLFYVYTIILAVIDPLWALYFAGVSVTVCALFLGIVNTWGHSDLYKTDGTHASNIGHNIILWGEGDHKEHHKKPSAVQMSRTDLGYYFIKLIGNIRA